MSTNLTSPPPGKTISKQNPRFGNPKQHISKKSSNLKSGFFSKLTKKSSQKSIRDKRNVSNANESMVSRTSFLENVNKVGGTILRKTKSMLSLRNQSMVRGKEFFFANARNKWRAEKSTLFTCDNRTNNSPVQIEWRGFSFCISQNTNENKPEGQDAIGVAFHRNWEVFVLCDGHDQDGHFVSQGVCSTLPHFILRRIFDGKRENVDKMVEDTVFVEAFAEAEETVCWAKDLELEQGIAVKILDGEFAGQVGYIAQIEDEDSDEDLDSTEEPSPLMLTVVIDNEEVGYQRFEISENEVVTPRYKGGSTCLCLLRNTQTNKCKVAVLGDSRLMLLGDIGSKFKDDDFIDPVLMETFVESDTNSQDEVEGAFMLDEEETIGFFTPQHNVYNANERERLKAYQEKMNGQYVVNLEDGYLVNPETQMQIQPTRGFGDVEMQSAGYSHVPEISSEFALTPGTVLIGASDGIFEAEIWANDEDFLKYVNNEKNGREAIDLTSLVFAETVKRCGDKSKLDDISMFAFIVPKTKRNYRKKLKPRKVSSRKKRNVEETLQRLRSSYRSRGMKLRRTTITRSDIPGAHLFRKFFTKRSAQTADEKVEENPE